MYAAPTTFLPEGQGVGVGTTHVQLSGHVGHGTYEAIASHLIRTGDRPWALVKADEMGCALPGRPSLNGSLRPVLFGHALSRSRPSTTSSRCCRASMAWCP
eukprot:445139-Prymnesium_polylepis.1